MDILGAVASTVQLLNNVILTIQSIRNVPTKIRVQGKVLKELLIITEEVQENRILQVGSITSILDDMSGTVKSIQKRLPNPQKDRKKLARHWQSVKYYFREDDVLALMQSLEPAKSSLLLCIANILTNYAGRSSDRLEDIKMKVDQMHRSLSEASTTLLEEPRTVRYHLLLHLRSTYDTKFLLTLLASPHRQSSLHLLPCLLLQHR